MASGEQRAVEQGVGIDIELENREFQVGPFSLDLIGKEVSTGSTVIIENQYGSTNHGRACVRSRQLLSARAETPCRELTASDIENRISSR